MVRDVLEYDVAVVGAGPSGLSAAIKLKQLAMLENCDISVCVLEKASAVGTHNISGCIFNPSVLNELIPNWQEKGFSLKTKVASEELLYLTAANKYALPINEDLRNDGNYIISLGALCRDLAKYAEELGVDIFPGFAATDYLLNDAGVVTGVVTGDMGRNKDGSESDEFQLGVEIRTKQIVLAEGCRGSLTKQIIQDFNLENPASQPSYGLGFKEIWQIDPMKHKLGHMVHTLGYPLDKNTYGGGFVYFLDNNKVALGFIPALDYKNTEFNPYLEFQKFKLHPYVKNILEGGERLEYGARTVVESGILGQPKLTFQGGVIVGDAAGFLNVPKVKGVHNSMYSGILAATGVFAALNSSQIEAAEYPKLYKNSWLYKDLYKVRNIRPAFQYGRLFGLVFTALDLYVFKGRLPFSFKFKHADNQSLTETKPIVYPEIDNKITFNLSSSLHLANLQHHNQPIHLKLKDASVPIKINLVKYNAPETKYCPGGVYEIVKHNGQNELLINSANCLHCKACDIKDPTGNITWTPPEGGSGPQYTEM